MGSERRQPLRLDLAGAPLEADLTMPDGVLGLVVFAHGSGSSRHISRNRSVAGVLHQAGFGTLLLDLLTPDEERVDAMSGEFRFDIHRLGHRVIGAIDWAAVYGATALLPLGIFGASTGAAAALVAAANRPSMVAAVVSRGGRPDLARDILEEVTAPTLLIVGGDDASVIDLNRDAFGRLRCPKQLQIVPGATHLFEEPGALAQVSTLAKSWFLEHVHAPRS